jgi:copper chaperone NosL
MNTNKMQKLSRLLCLVGSAALVASLFVPLWRIELDAPQYPEGLALLIFPHKLGGDVDIINGLNHYIGMRTLHAEDFIEFTVLPYIITLFAALVLLAAGVGKKKLLYFVFGAFVLFGIVAMIDFWRWEYDYGHNLDPNAAIIVPGMAYQPPLIGFKQLLNFGAYSIPDIGGWLFIGCGLLLLTAVVLEFRSAKKLAKVPTMVMVFLSASMLMSCTSGNPEPIKLHADKCDFCKMTIADGRFAAELITEKGRVYKFDDVLCMIEYTVANPEPKAKALWVTQYDKPGGFIQAEQASYVKSEELKSPMRGNLAAFAGADAAKQLAAQFQQAELKSWEAITGK